ncbi:MAG: hypothetical protein H7068_01905 [Pedobacter sp.]|nr:hypothetical protein [Chitinophagaceae bacterium]
MEDILGFLFTHIKLLIIIGVGIILLKSVIIMASKGGDLYLVVESFFKFYSRVEISLSTNNKELFYKKSNNYINIILYSWLIFLIMLIFISKDLNV